jgi:hypothetical protein
MFVTSMVLTQPLLLLQLSSVHRLLSSQPNAPVPLQTPKLLQASVGVQTSPSEHSVPFKAALPVFWQAPVLVLQLSLVQGLLSLQLAKPV